MKFKFIDRENWYRKEYFEHYLQQQTTFSMTNNINISILLKNIKKKKYKLYPAFIYMVTKTVNSHREFRTCFNSEGELGYWEEMIPSYTIFDNESLMFSSIWTQNSSSFAEFYDMYQDDVEKYNSLGNLFPKLPIPVNNFPISMLPWSSFTGFNLNINNGGDFLLPIITAGKYSKKENEIFFPISIQLHHAVCDGYHASVFMNNLQKLADKSEDWL
ncbi:type A chloramphenicol O-acetyltransferase [Priestia megaterium]|uniref:type A chloramphenicol O-acetyltransferase n=1 Tax=Priestia megaterium TaxID=1404 RepID=UPI00159C5DB9|nr:type A chloramphenicol O-acetyltransferase [Priestia megaterium]